MPAGFCSPNDELAKPPNVLAPLFPNRLEVSDEMKDMCEGGQREENVLITSQQRRKEPPLGVLEEGRSDQEEQWTPSPICMGLEGRISLCGCPGSELPDSVLRHRSWPARPWGPTAQPHARMLSEHIHAKHMAPAQLSRSSLARWLLPSLLREQRTNKTSGAPTSDLTGARDVLRPEKKPARLPV